MYTNGIGDGKITPYCFEARFSSRILIYTSNFGIYCENPRIGEIADLDIIILF